MVDYTKFKDEWLNELNANGITNKEQIENDYNTTGTYMVNHKHFVESPINPFNEKYLNCNPDVSFFKVKWNEKTNKPYLYKGAR